MRLQRLTERLIQKICTLSSAVFFCLIYNPRVSSDAQGTKSSKDSTSRAPPEEISRNFGGGGAIFTGVNVNHKRGCHCRTGHADREPPPSEGRANPE